MAKIAKLIPYVVSYIQGRRGGGRGTTCPGPQTRRGPQLEKYPKIEQGPIKIGASTRH